MVNWIVTVTDEGAALIASVIASQGTLTITEARMSDEDYYGDESSLTEATFDGVYKTTPVSASIIDLTNIKMEAHFSLSGLTEAHEIATVGFIANDGGSDVLLAVLTTADTPDTAEPGININGGWVDFSISLAVSSTQDITVVGTTAGVQYQVLTTPLTINGQTETTVEGALDGLNDYGDALADNLAANENVYGAKNTWDYTKFVTGNGGFTQSNGVYTNALTDTRPSFQLMAKAFDSNSTDLGYVINEVTTGTGIKEFPASIPNNTAYLRIAHNGAMQDFTFLQPITQTGDVIFSLDLTSNDPSTVGGLSFTDVMLRDDRITDPTYEPYAKTNQQLTVDKAERNDLSTIHATGSTNTTGATILQDTYFYLNKNYCKALTAITNGATFTLNTNYKLADVGEELEEVNNRLNNAKIDPTWTSISADYTFPADGYLQLYALPNESVSVTIYDSTGNSSLETIASGSTTGYTVNPIYVKKGMQVHFNSSTSASSVARFKPFI